MRASSLVPAEVARIRRHGIRTYCWFPDDPVLYGICYRHVVEAYDVALHCGPSSILEFYGQRHRPNGVSLPFWTDDVAFPRLYAPERANIDLVFLGNCRGPVRRDRLRVISDLPFPARIYGRVEEGVSPGLWGGWLDQTSDISEAIARARIGLTIPQRFSNYKGTPYDFPGLAALGQFALPSRVVQYAAVGLPIVSVADVPSPWFPELVTVPDRREMVNTCKRLLQDVDHLNALGARTHRRFLSSFTAQSRVTLLEYITDNPDRQDRMSLSDRADMWRRVVAET